MKLKFLSLVANMMKITFRIDGIAYGYPVDLSEYEDY